MTHIDACRNFRNGSRRSSRKHLMLVDKILKIGPVLLETKRIYVGQVVGDRIDLILLRHHTAGGCP